MGTDKFESRRLNEHQINVIELIRSDFAVFFDAIDEHIPEGREKSLVITKLEEACMWAVKAVSRKETNKEDE